MRVFFAHAKSMEDGQIDQWSKDIKDILSQDAGVTVEIIPGRDDYQRYAAGAGSFSAWAREVPTRRDMATGNRYYDGFVSPTFYVGRATAEILSGAMAIGTPVLVFEFDDEKKAYEPHRVNQVVVVDSEDYLKGWYLDT